MAEFIPVPFGDGSVDVYDGDTTYNGGQGERLYGIDSAEMKNRNVSFGEVGYEEAGARNSRDRLAELLRENPTATREIVDTDAYGRHVVKYVKEDGTTINEQLVREGHAASYDFGGHTSEYADAHFDYLRELRAGARSVTRGQMQMVKDATSRPNVAQELGVGFRRGVDQTAGFLNYGMSQMAEMVGMEDLAESLYVDAETAFDEANKHEAAIGSWKEAKESGKYAVWAAGLLGEQAPQMAFDIAAGIATGGTGAAASIAAKKAGFGLMSASLAKSLSFTSGAVASQYTQMVGSVAQELKKNGINDPTTAMLYALPATGLDYIALKSMLSTAGRMYKEGKAGIGKELVAGVLKGSMFEGGTEAAQEFIAKSAVASLNSNFDVFSDDNIDDYVESFMAGFTVGGAVSTVRGLAPRSIEKQNQRILGLDESREEVVNSGEEPITITTTAADGARMQEVTRPSRAETVIAKHRASLGEDSESVTESPRAEIDRRTEGNGAVTSNGDHIRENASDVAKDVRGAIDGRKPAALTDIPTMQSALDSLDEATRNFAEANSVIFETEDERAIITNKDNKESIDGIRDTLNKDGVKFTETTVKPRPKTMEEAVQNKDFSQASEEELKFELRDAEAEYARLKSVGASVKELQGQQQVIDDIIDDLGAIPDARPQQETGVRETLTDASSAVPFEAQESQEAATPQSGTIEERAPVAQNDTGSQALSSNSQQPLPFGDLSGLDAAASAAKPIPETTPEPTPSAKAKAASEAASEATSSPEVPPLPPKVAKSVVPSNGARFEKKTVAQAVSNATVIGRGFAHAGANLLSNPVQTSRRMINALKALTNAATFLRTADAELRLLGGGGRVIADKFKRMISGTTSDVSIWSVRAERVLASMTEEQKKNFANGSLKDAPPQLLKFFRDMHKYAKEHIKDLGDVGPDFVPRFFNRENIEGRKQEFAEMLVDQAKLAGYSMSMEEALLTTSAILEGDTRVSSYLQERTTLSGPTTQHKKTRNLHFIDEVKMRKEGFLVADPSSILASYVNHITRRTNYEKQFGEYVVLGGETEVKEVPFPTREFAARKILHHALLHNAIWHEVRGKMVLLTHDEKQDLFSKPIDDDFLSYNEPYLNQLVKRGVLRRPDANSIEYDGALGWSFYDQNKHLRDMGSTLDKRGKARLMTIVDAYAGRLGSDKMSLATRRLQSNIMAYENLTVLLMSVFSQFADMAGMIFRNRDMEGAFIALNEARKILFTAEGKERRALMEDLGFAERQLSMQALLEAQGLQHQTDGARKVNEMLFKYNGVQSLTNLTRVMTAAIGQKFIERHAEKAANGDARSARYLRELGLTEAEASEVGKAGFKHFNHYLELGDVGENASPESKLSEKIHNAMFMFTDSAVVRPDVSQRPVWASDPRFAIIWHLKSFMYAYGHTILKGLGKEMSTRFDEKRAEGNGYAASLGDAAVPLMMYALPVFMLSAMGLELREKVQYELWGEKPPTDAMDTQTYAFEVLKRGGILGAGELGYAFIDARDRGQSPIGQLMGPTVSHLEVFLELDLAKAAARSTPLVNQVPPIRDWYKGLFGG